ncbi:serine/threonine-protein kinase MARK2-like [Phyllostomus discolor]|uniref:non-specific serine/threonine protein kinase n=1 Tax=Phyllostomus discolor TaxID=89673 RepID=A0A6J2N3I4_9CHIR|nr:serine/threonine-protein kinase MARK2-like [Phyllostomus discolor]
MSDDFAATCGNKKHDIGDYIPLKSIGQGSFAEVKLAQHSLTGTKVALKSLSQWGLTRESEEMKSLKTIHHPNIIALFEVITTRDKHILIMEYASRGDLFDHLEECGRKTEHEARPMFRQMISALHYCHRKNIVHRDLKPENILLDEDLNVKVADFGFSRDFTNYELTTVCGTYAYMAPEILERQVYDGPKADVWSLGVILYRMLTGDELFVGDTAGEVKKEIQSKKLCLPDFTSVEVQDLLQKMLSVDPSQRPTLDDIMKDTWVNMGEDEEMRPYSEPPWGDIDPQVAKIMKGMGFKEQEIRESLTQSKYDRVMGTYLILRRKTTKMQGRTIKVRPCPSSDPSTSTSCSEEAETPIPSTSPASSLDSSSSPSPGGKGARKKGLPPRVEARMSPCPAPSLQPSSSWSTRTPEETVPAPPPSPQSSSSLSTRTPEETVPAPPPSPQSSSSSSTRTPEETVPAPPPSPQSSSSWSTRTPEETVPAPPPSPQSSSSSSTCTPEEMVPVPPPSLQSSSLAYSPALEARTTTPLHSPQSGTTTPSPALQRGPGGSPTTHSSSNSSSCQHISELGGGTPSFPSRNRHGQKQVAQRILRFFLKCICCSPSTKKRRVIPK